MLSLKTILLLYFSDELNRYLIRRVSRDDYCSYICEYGILFILFVNNLRL